MTTLTLEQSRPLLLPAPPPRGTVVANWPPVPGAAWGAELPAVGWGGGRTGCSGVPAAVGDAEWDVLGRSLQVGAQNVSLGLLAAGEGLPQLLLESGYVLGSPYHWRQGARTFPWGSRQMQG